MIKVNGKALRIGERMTVFHHFARRNDFETISPKMVYRKEGGKDRMYVPDDFQDEIVLGIDHIERSCGNCRMFPCRYCQYPAGYFRTDGRQIYMVVGGTHLVDGDAERIRRTVEELKK